MEITRQKLAKVIVSAVDDICHSLDDNFVPDYEIKKARGIAKNTGEIIFRRLIAETKVKPEKKNEGV
jgi:hypothetical protein